MEVQSGIPKKELIAWFQSISKEQQGDTFTGPDWAVELGPEEQIPTGPFTLPRTKIIFNGNPITCKNLVESYRMKFLSAGG